MVLSRLAPQPIPDNFRWTTKYVHLTYAGHIPVEEILANVRNATSVLLVGWSICHEDTSSISDDGTQVVMGYAHTHVALIFAARLGMTGSRKFDVVMDDYSLVHPHHQPHVSINAMEKVFTNYHAGRKWDMATNKYMFTPPVLHEYKLPPMFSFERETLTEVCNTPSLFEACLAGEIRPRTVNDIHTLREESAAHDAKRFKHLYPRDSFKDLAPVDWGTEFATLHVYGPSGVGKTKWACAQFENPCFIKPFDSIGCVEALAKQFDPNVHDGLVLDEVDLSFMSRQTAIGFVDKDEPCTLDVRYKAFKLPPVKKLLVSNPAPYPDLYPLDPHGAIRRRLGVLHITSQTWNAAPVLQV